MRSDHLAESILTVVWPPDRAAAAVGDLLEDMAHRGTRWFWRSVLLTGLAAVRQQVETQPWQILFYGAVAWFGYMLTALLVLVCAQMALLILWLAADVAAHHTGLELVLRAAGWAGDWNPAPPAALVRALDLLAIAVVTPYLTGLRLADLWHERAVAFTLALVVVWSVMLTVVPFVSGAGLRVTMPMLSTVVPCMLAGVVRQRLRALRP